MEDCLGSTHQLHFRQGTSFWNNALYSATGDKFHAGTVITLSKFFSERITGRGAPIEGRAQFVTIEVNKHHIGILNIYAPNDTGARVRFWSKLADFPFPSAEWIVGGDFNMTELPEDRSDGFHARCVGRREEGA